MEDEKTKAKPHAHDLLVPKSEGAEQQAIRDAGLISQLLEILQDNTIDVAVRTMATLVLSMSAHSEVRSSKCSVPGQEERV